MQAVLAGQLRDGTTAPRSCPAARPPDGRRPRPAPSRPSPCSAIQGARMKIACTGPPVDAVDLEVGLERVQLPAEGVALGQHVEDPEVRAVEHDHARAGAEDRGARRPPARRAAASRPSRSMPSVITVDSPPGSTSASSPSRSAGTRTCRVAAPSRLRTRSCASNPPCRARIPTSGDLWRAGRRRAHQPRGESSCSASSFEVSMLSIAAPRPVEAAATRAGSA